MATWKSCSLWAGEFLQAYFDSKPTKCTTSACPMAAEVVVIVDDQEVRIITIWVTSGISETEHISDQNYEYHDRRQEVVYETPEQKLRTAIIKLGEVVNYFSFVFLPRADLTCSTGRPGGASSSCETDTWTDTYCYTYHFWRVPHRVWVLRSHFVSPLNPRSVTEQPYKIPFYAALLRLLHDPEDTVESASGPSLGKQILEDFWKGFQAFLDKLAWREARLCVSKSYIPMIANRLTFEIS